MFKQTLQTDEVDREAFLHPSLYHPIRLDALSTLFGAEQTLFSMLARKNRNFFAIGQLLIDVIAIKICKDAKDRFPKTIMIVLIVRRPP